MVDEIGLTSRRADAVLAGFVGSPTSKTRAALAAIMPKATGPAASSLAQWVRQRADGSWPNPVRGGNIAGRIYVSTTVGGRAPAQGDGLTVGDSWWSPTGARIATAVPAAGAVTWVTIGGATTPTDPTPGGDTSTPAATARPFALLATTGVWRSTAGNSLVESLSDQATSGVTADAAASGGVSITLGMGNFAHTAGNDIVVILWGAASESPGDVTAIIGKGDDAYTSLKAATVTATPSTVELRWPATDLTSIPTDRWRDVNVTITRNTGGFSALADITLQSVPPVITPPSGSDPLTPITILWAPSSLWYSDLTTAPLANASTAIASYVRSQTTVPRLDCYSDAPPMWMVPASTPRINVTPPASSTRGAVTLMHTTDGKGALDAVPIPMGAVTPANTFGTMVIACVETKQVWELLGAKKAADGSWSAEWGGRIDGFDQSVGAMPTSTGYTGSGLAFTGAAVKVAEAADAAAGNVKAIPHAVGLNLPYGAASSQFCWPATRSDGNAYDAGAPLMGQRLRLKATADLSGCTPLGKAVGEAMKRYGAVILGGSDKTSIVCESGSVVQAGTGVDPWGSILGGKSVDTILAGLPLDQLEAVSPGWGSPTWKAEPVVAPTPDPVTPTPGTGTGGYRTSIYYPADGGWLSGASCKAIEFGADGMGSPFAQWRGEPCTMARTWWDQESHPKDTLHARWGNWHASIDCGPGLMFKGESWDTLANSNNDGHAKAWARLRDHLKSARDWYLSRRDPKKVNCFISLAHEMNGDWYRWSINPGNKAQFITIWKRYREAQLAVFPEALLTWNSNYDTKASVGMDWRRYIPDYESKGAAGVKQWIDVGSVDYYNAWSVWANTVQGWNDIAYSKVDQWGAPIGLDKHRQFWESCGLPMTVPEWGGHATRHGDAPEATTAINTYFRKWAGVGPGRVLAEAYFNLTSGYDSGDSPGKFAIYGDTVALTGTAARYRALTWGK